MLIVTRRKGQRIVIGNDIEIVISDVSRGGVKIGIVAPSSLSILRGELKDAVVQANLQALASSFALPLSPDEAASAVPELAPGELAPAATLPQR